MSTNKLTNSLIQDALCDLAKNPTNCSLAQYYVGLCSVYGHEITQDIYEGVKNIRLAARAGNTNAQNWMGIKEFSKGKVAEALSWFELSYEAGDPKGRKNSEQVCALILYRINYKNRINYKINSKLLKENPAKWLEFSKPSSISSQNNNKIINLPISKSKSKSKSKSAIPGP